MALFHVDYCPSDHLQYYFHTLTTKCFPEIAGESCSVEKDVECTSTTNAVYQDKKNILFSVGVITHTCISLLAFDLMILRSSAIFSRTP